MLNSLRMSLKIDYAYSLNSFIYNLRRLPIFKDLITDDLYKSKNLKKVVAFLSTGWAFFKTIFFNLLYFFSIYFLASLINKSHLSLTFIHIYFIFTIIGFFINNRLLNTSKKKYFSIVLFKMDAKEFMESSLVYNLFKYLLLHSFSFLVISFFVKIPLLVIVQLVLLAFFSRITGEALNILFYKRYSYVWLNNYYLYFSILISLLVLSFLPLKNIFISSNLIFIVLLIFIIISPFSFRYLVRVKDYKLIFKKLNTKNMALSEQEALSYSRQQMVEVKKKDINISSKRLKNKKGYDLFNTIFFERHREILLRSAKKFSLVLAIIYIVLGFLVLNDANIFRGVNAFFSSNLGWFVLIMYFINRGAIVTQAMFFNCDHAMLRYNFYREPKVLLGLFKKRLKLLIKVNLLPATVMVLGNSLLLYLTLNKEVYAYLVIAFYIITLSIFFSVHYLVIYYLLQPYNSEMQLKKVSYSLVSILTYGVCYYVSTVRLNYLSFGILFIIFTLLYSAISLYLVYKFSPRTFKIN